MNITNLLKYCPKGTKLYSTICGEVELDKVTNLGTIEIKTIEQIIRSSSFTLDYEGRYSHGGECVLFPSKEQRDWNKFKLPVKRGDIMMKLDGSYPFISNGVINEDGCFEYICGVSFKFGDLRISNLTGLSTIWTNEFCIPASKEAKKALFDRMKEAGYKWNTDTLELENIENKPKKQYFKQFKPFDKVLVRNSSDEKWSINLFSYYDLEDTDCPYVCLNESYHYCIPYADYNKHVLGTTIIPNDI